MQNKSKILKNDLGGLTAFVDGIAKNKLVVQVGIMGNKSQRRGGGDTNADIGLVHEFGTNRIPKRSFLRMPLFQKTDQILAAVKNNGALKKLAKGNIMQVLMDLGVACEAAIEEAFESHGFGSWKPNAPSTIKRKGASSPLIDTAQLRRSITSRVVKP